MVLQKCFNLYSSVGPNFTRAVSNGSICLPAESATCAYTVYALKRKRWGERVQLRKRSYLLCTHRRTIKYAQTGWLAPAVRCDRKTDSSETGPDLHNATRRPVTEGVEVGVIVPGASTRARANATRRRERDERPRACTPQESGDAVERARRTSSVGS